MFVLETYPTQDDEVRRRIVELAASHISYIEKIQEKVNLQFLKALMSNSIVSRKNCINILENQLVYMTKVQAKECLRIAGLQEFSAIFDGERPYVQALEVNKLFLDCLVKNGIITKYIVIPGKEAYYKVFGKTKYSKEKQRVHEIARELNMTNKDILKILQEAGSNVNSHMSLMTEKEYEILGKEFKI